MPADAARTARRRAADTPRERLLRSGLVLARRSGLRSLTVRALANHAGVNLGSFVYHFGSQDAFKDELMERWYAPLWAELQVAVDDEPLPLDRLRRLVRCLFEWVAANRGFVGHVLLDMAAGEPAARRFMRTLVGRHPALIASAIRDAQAAGQVVAGNPLHLMAFMLAAVGAPILIGHGIASQRLAAAEVSRALLDFAITPAQIEQRLQWAIAGIAARPPGDGA